MRTETIPNEAPLLISRREAARLLGISLRTLEKMIKRGDVPSRVLRRRRLIPRAFLMGFVGGFETFEESNHV
ncbi:MAG: excisionase family DNA-binding protein [Terriglobales bacterium]